MTTDPAREWGTKSPGKMCRIEPWPRPRVDLHPNQQIGRDVPTEDNRDGVVLDDHGCREPSCWTSLTTGASGFGRLPGSGKKFFDYDPS